MKKVLIASAAMSVLATASFAGGPVVIKTEPAPVVVPAQTTSSNGWLPLAAGAVILCAVLCGGDGT